MKKLFIFFVIMVCSVFMYGQQADSTSKKQLHQHYISINPLNCLVQQVGISYEYKQGRVGFGITPGYIYPDYGDSFTRWFITGPSSYGAYGAYSGFFIEPQINYYLSKNKINEKRTIFYISLRGVYKYLKLDSTGIYTWEDGTSGDDYFIYRKQVDRCNIAGAFILFGKKHYHKHFFNDMYFGFGLLAVKHNLIVAGEYIGNDHTNNSPSNINPPQKEVFNQIIPTITLGLNLGYKY
jgi:hypothetical protein